MLGTRGIETSWQARGVITLGIVSATLTVQPPSARATAGQPDVRVPVGASPVPRYAITDLGPIGYFTETYAGAVNSAGHAVGVLIGVPPEPSVPFLYRDGEMIELDTLGGSYSAGMDINEAGVVAGHSARSPETGTRASVWEGDQLIDLGVLDNSPSEDLSHAMALNNVGQVVGHSNLPWPIDRHAFLWDSINGMQDLGPVDSIFSEALDINDSGAIVGRADIPDLGNVAVMWEGDTLTILGALSTEFAFSTARGINEAGEIVGETVYDSESCDFCSTGFHWYEGVMADLEEFSCTQCFSSQAVSVNEAGQVVGDAFVEWLVTRACIWNDGHIANLNDLIPPDSGWTLRNAESISNAGHIVGWGYLYGGDDARAYLLTPLPPGDGDGDGDLDLDDHAGFAACMSGPGVSYDSDGTATHDVSVGPGFSFSPADITIEVGDSIRWVWAGGLHNVESGVDGIHDGNFLSGSPTSAPDTTYELLFDAAFLLDNPITASSYPYYCVVHEDRGMVGSVTVEADPCAVFDLDDDGDVDVADFKEFQAAFTG